MWGSDLVLLFFNMKQVFPMQWLFLNVIPPLWFIWFFSPPLYTWGPYLLVSPLSSQFCSDDLFVIPYLSYWMTAPIRRTWIWANSGSWWSTGRPGVLRSWGRKESDTIERLNWTELNLSFCRFITNLDVR